MNKYHMEKILALLTKTSFDNQFFYFKMSLLIQCVACHFFVIIC